MTGGADVKKSLRSYPASMKKLISLALVALFALTTTAPSSASLAEFNLGTLIGENGRGLQGVYFDDQGLVPRDFSVMMAIAAAGGNGSVNSYICKNITEGYCFTATQKKYHAVLGPCNSTRTINCIDSIEAITTSGKSYNATFQSHYPTQSTEGFPGVPKRNVPDGTSPSIWTFNSAPGIPSDLQFLAAFTLEGFIGGQQWDLLEDPLKVSDLHGYLTPVTIKTGEYSRSFITSNYVVQGDRTFLDLGNGFSAGNSSKASTFECVAIEDGSCAIEKPFPKDVQFKANLRLSQSPSGWIHGRLMQAKVELAKRGSEIDLSIQGAPISTPVVGIVTEWKDKPEGLGPWFYNYSEEKFRWRDNFIGVPNPDSQDAFKLYKVWSPLMKDKANGLNEHWAFRTLSYSGDTTNCFNDKENLVGVVSTNSMIYSSGPPAFNPQTQTLDYSLASPHYTPTGDTFKGTYDLQLRSDVARCVYGFSKAPISASISIISEEGQKSVATTTLGEKNGWLRLGAYNFTFSSPTVQVKLTQEKSSTITCVKGKSSKKVTGVNPKCPTGFKKR